MAKRLRGDPTYDLSRHIVTGEKPPFGGDPTIQQYADPTVDRNDPMEDFTAGVGDNFIVPQTADEVQLANLTQAVGLDSGDGRYGQSAVDMATASNCDDEATKGGLQYGPRFTGGY